MQKMLRPYLTTGLAVAGASLIAVAPAVAPLPGVAPAPASQPHSQRAVTLTAGPTEVLSPYSDLITTTASNLNGLTRHLFDFPALTQFFHDPAGSLAQLPDVATLFNTWLPSIDVQSSGLPIVIGGELPPPLTTTLGVIGPLVTLANAVGPAVSQITDSDDAAGALAGVVNAPATLLNAFLNGQDGVDVLDQHIPLFNGLLVPGQQVSTDLSIGQLVELAGVGQTTIGELADQAGLSDMSLASIAIQGLAALGVDNPSITALANQFGLGEQSVAGLAIQLLGSAGIDNPSIGELADQAGLADQSIAAVLSQVLNMAGFDTDQSLTGLALRLLDSAGLGNDPSVAELAGFALNAAGMGDLTIGGLADQLGVGGLTAGELLKTAVASLAGPDATVTELLEQFGPPDMTLGELATTALTAVGIGTKTPAELFDSIFNPNVSDNITLGELVMKVMPSNPDGSAMTIQDVLANAEMSDKTLGELLNSVPISDDDPDEMLGQMGWKDFLNSDFTNGIGTQTLKQLGAEDWQCVFLDLSSTPCSTPFANLMGDKTVYETLHYLTSNGSLPGITPAVSPGTPLTDITLAQLLAATMNGNDPKLAQIVAGLNLDTPMDDILHELGLDQVTINDMVVNSFPGLANTPVVSILSDWNLDTLPVATVIDRLGLDMTVMTALQNLDIDNLKLTSLADQLLGGVPIRTVLNGLGLDNVTLQEFLNNLLGGIKVGSLLDDLNLSDVHLNDVITSLLGDVQVNQILTSLGMDNVYLNPVITELLGNLTLGTILDDLGVSDANIDNVLDGLGIAGVDVLGVRLGDFAGELWNFVVDIPQQMASAMGG